LVYENTGIKADEYYLANKTFIPFIRLYSPYYKINNMKKLLTTCSIFFLFSFFSTLALSQCWTVYYCDGCVRNGLCPVSQTFATYDDALASAKYACPGAPPNIVVSSCDNQNNQRKPRIITPVSFGFTFGILGALGASFAKDANGKNQWDAGFAGGFGFGVFLSELVKPKKRSLVKNIALGLIGGGGLGYAEAKMEVLNKPATPAPPDKTLERTLEGAAGGAVINAVFTGFHKEKLGSKSSLIRRSNFLSNMAFTMSGNRVGVIIRL
jgi:hypothetical protein